MSGSLRTLVLEVRSESMHSVFVSAQLDVPAARAWSEVGDPASLGSWHPAFDRTPVSGIDRTCVLKDGGVVRERIDERHDDQRRYRYSIIDSPLPIRDYQAIFSVKDLGSNRCAIEWSSIFEVSGGGDRAMIELVQSIYTSGLESVRQRLG
jgi:hypothetical protein